MRLAGTGWALHHKPVGFLKPPDDLNLLVIEGFGEKELRMIWVVIEIDIAAAEDIRDVARIIAERFEILVDSVARPQYEGAGGALDFRCLVFIAGDVRFELLDIAEHRIA